MVIKRVNSRGSSLIETVIALFVITSAITTVAALYASTLRNQSADIRNTIVVNLAENRLAQLRHVASQDLASFRGLDSESGTTTDSAHPGYSITTSVDSVELPHPCTGLVESRIYEEGTRRVSVRVTDPQGNDFTFDTLISEPITAVETAQVRLTGGATTIARDASVTLTAELLDSDGVKIPDIEFAFYVDLTDGNGTLSPNPDGETVSFRNVIPNFSDPTNNIYTGGTARIIARAFYAGREYRAVSQDLFLTP